MWFTNTGDGYGSIGEITFTASGQVQQVYNYPGTSANGIDDPTSITAGPDGSGGQALWFTNYSGNSIGEITTAGTVYNYPLNRATSGVSSPYGITAGPNGTVWFTFVAGGENATGGIGEITPAGLGQAPISYPSSDASILNPHGITAGPDGALWFANNDDGTGTTIGRITTTPTTVNGYSGPGVDGPESITPAPDGARELWFTNYSGNSIGEITTPAPQTITVTSTPPSPAVYGGRYTPVAAGGSGQPVTFTVDPASTAGACTINSSGLASFTGVGTCIIDANQAGNADWLPAPQVQQSFTIGQAGQTITFTSIPPVSPPFGSTYPVSATGGGSGNPVTFVIDAEGLGPCVISGSTVTFIGAGSCVIGANQAWQRRLPGGVCAAGDHGAAGSPGADLGPAGEYRLSRAPQRHPAGRHDFGGGHVHLQPAGRHGPGDRRPHPERPPSPRLTRPTTQAARSAGKSPSSSSNRPLVPPVTSRDGVRCNAA